MYTILVVDDEPMICQGISRLLASSGLAVGQVHLAYNAYEALDCIRMEEIDLIITDIQMGDVSGLDLIQQARLIKPWLQTIIISAHELFHYAQTAVRLGVKDYLVKPLNEEQLLVSVRNALLRASKPVMAATDEASGSDLLHRGFQMAEPNSEQNRLFASLQRHNISLEIWSRLEQLSGAPLAGPDYAVIRIQLPDKEGPSRQDVRLIRYAALNVAKEVLHEEASHIAAYLGESEIGVLLQWNSEGEATAVVRGVDKLYQLDMLGRGLQHSIQKYLRLDCVIGISQVMSGRQFVYKLFEQAQQALTCRQDYPDHSVFYYGDFAWSLMKQEESTEEGRRDRNNQIVEKAKDYIHDHYNQKGLTLHEVALQNHVSPNYLSCLFKKNTGLNLWEYVIKLRMEESRRLIEQTDLRRYEIAERVGYESPEHFSKIFKKFYGFSPSELKK